LEVADRCWLIQEGRVEAISPEALKQRLRVNALNPFHDEVATSVV
jgi:hypothetical protein